MQIGMTKDRGLYNKPSAAVHPGALAAATLPQYNRTESLHLPGDPVTAAVLMTAIKETHCTLNRRFNISGTKQGRERTN